MIKSSSKDIYDFHHEVALEELKGGKVDSTTWSKALSYRGQKSGQTDSFYIMMRVINLYFKDRNAFSIFNIYFLFSLLKFITSSKRFWLAAFLSVFVLSFASTGLLPRYEYAKNGFILDTWTGELRTSRAPKNALSLQPIRSSYFW